MSTQATVPPLPSALRTPEAMRWIHDRFKLDGLERLARSTQDYYDDHGHYLPDVAALAHAALVALGTTPRAMLAEFHAAVGHPETDALWLRCTLHDEEHAELVEALEEGDAAHIARELADVVYVAFGTAHAYGIDLDSALAEVHRANMHKAAAGVRREDGKIVKPPGFVAPDMTEAIRDAA